MTIRTFGWIQNPSSFENLQRVVQIFIKGSPQHKRLLNLLKERVVITDAVLCKHLLNTLTAEQIAPTYADLVGTGSSKRSEAVCDALAQVSIVGQIRGRQCVDNWTADGFVRWAECLGFIDYHDSNDTFTLSPLGKLFGDNVVDEFKDNEALHVGLLAYPPTERVLQLLADQHDKTPDYLSKFQIGSQLGFSGEAGFTSFPHNIIMRQLAIESNSKELTKIRQDKEGSSDKYARMISRWLCTMGWVEQVRSDINNPNFDKPVHFGHNFRITLSGLGALRKIKGGSIHKRTIKRVSWSMLATNAANRDYLRNRRAKLLNFLLRRAKQRTTLDQVTAHLKEHGFEHPDAVYIKDIKGLNGCGIPICETTQNGINYYQLEASFPVILAPTSVRSAKMRDVGLEKQKEDMLKRLQHIEPEWVELIEISREGSQSAVFEAQVVNLLETHYGLGATHLGGASKPDGVCYFVSGSPSWGVIIDTKAYRDGYRFTASEKDKMIRYINDNKNRDVVLTPNAWWQEFPDELDHYYFMFISSTFPTNAATHIEYIARATEVDGGALNVEQLLLGADHYAKHPDDVGTLNTLICNDQMTIVKATALVNNSV